MKIATINFTNKNNFLYFNSTANLDDTYQLNGGVYFVDDLPLTVSGKIIQRIARMFAEKEFSSRNKGST